MSIHTHQYPGREPISVAVAEHWLRIGEDTRRALWAGFRLSSEDPLYWPTLWAIAGLSPDQPTDLHLELKRPLWETKDVADYIRKTSKTVASWHKRNSYPEGFPRPAIVVGPRKKLWLPIDIEAYRHGSHFKKKANQIRRSGNSATRVAEHKDNPTVTLEPLDD